MSLDASLWAWKKQMKPHLKLVLLSLADRADANFECFPKVSTIAKDTCQTERSVRRQLDELIELGLIEDSGKRIGRTNKTKVWRLVGAIDRTSADKNPESNADTESTLKVKSGHSVRSNVDTESGLNADTESGSYIEPPIEESIKGTSKSLSKDLSGKPAGVDRQVWTDFIRQRKTALTPTALNRIKKEAEKAGWELTDALEESVTRGWQSFKADWVSKQPIPRQTQDIQSNGLPKGMRWAGGAR